MQDNNSQPTQQPYYDAPPRVPQQMQPQYLPPMQPMQAPMQQPVQPPMPQDRERFQQTFQPVTRPPFRRQYFGTDRKGILFATILLCLSVMCANAFIFADHPGFGASIFTVAIFFTLAVYLFHKRKATTVYGVFACLAYLAFAVSFTITGSNVFLVINALFVLSGVIYMEFMRQRRFDGFRSIGDLCHSMFVLTFGRMHYGVYALFHRQDADGSSQKRKSGGVLLGILIALPFLLVIVPLLIQSDAAFENLLASLTLTTVKEIAVSVFFGLLIFVLLFSRAECISREERKAPAKRGDGGLEPVIILSFLSVIFAIYIVYLFSQLAYFFNGFAGILPKGYSVAEYARRGFFEMSAVCAINLLIVFLGNLLCSKKDGETPRAVKLLSLCLCIVSLILAATVLSKIGLYIRSFGMTRLRILTSLFTVLMIVVFLAVSIRLFKKNVPYMKIALVAASLLLLFATFADVDRLIAAYNIRAYQTGKLDSIDMETIEELDSHTVVPYVFDLIADDNPEVSQKAKQVLSRHADQLMQITSSETPKIIERYGDWRSWNLADAQAADLLEENLQSYYLINGNRHR